MKRHIFQSLWISSALLAGIGLISLPAEAVSAAQRPSTSPPQIQLGGDAAAVKTSGGTSWILSVTDSNQQSALQVSITRSVTTIGDGQESHTWSFDTPASSLVFNTKTGSGTVTGGAATSPIAKIQLTFTTKRRSREACGTGSETMYKGFLKGTAEIVSGLPRGGTVGGTRLGFGAKGSAPDVVVGTCTGTSDTCLSSVVADSPYSPAGVYAQAESTVEDGKQIAEISVSRTVHLTSPSQASRTDAALVTPPTPPKWNNKTHVLTVTSTRGGMVTGSATISGGAPSSFSFSCKFGGKRYKVSVVTDTNARYWSPEGDALTGHTVLSGNLLAPRAGTGLYYVTTVS